MDQTPETVGGGDGKAPYHLRKGTEQPHKGSETNQHGARRVNPKRTLQQTPEVGQHWHDHVGGSFRQVHDQGIARGG